MRPPSRNFESWLRFAVVGLLLAGCSDAAPPTGAESARLSLVVVFSAEANRAAQAFAAAAIDIDRAHVVVTRPPSETLADTTIALVPTSGQLLIELRVRASVGEVLNARIEFSSGAVILFAGSGTVTARALDDASASPSQIPVVAVGPGSTATRVTVTPPSGTFPTTTPVTFTGHAFDASNAEIAGALFSWSVDNSAIGSVSVAGVVQPTILGGTLRVRATTLNNVVGEAVVTFQAPPGQLALGTQPAGAVSGIVLSSQPVIQVRDASNNLVATSTAAVTVAIASGTGALLGTKTVNAVRGVATFTDLRIDGFGAHTLTFTATGFTAATSSSLTVVQTPAALSIVTGPGGATSGRPLSVQPVIRILDNAGLLVAGSTLAVTASVASGNGIVLGTTTVNAVNGVATFTDLRVDGAGAVVLTFSTANPVLRVSSQGFAVNPVVPTLVAITTQPGGAVSGVNFTTQPVVEIRDASNAVVVGSTASVLATIATGSGNLVGSTTVNAVNGVATFTNLRINGAGPFTLTFTAIGLTTATSAGFVVTQTPGSLFIQTQPASAISGAPLGIQPVIRILDNANLLIANSTLTVTATITSGNGTITAGRTVNAVGGVATFTNLTITGSGAHVLTFSIVTPALTIASAPFAVNVPSAPPP